MNELSVFNYEQNEVRVVVKDDGPWWVLADVCRVLEIQNNRNVARRLDEDEKGVHLMDTLGGNQKLTIISESGFYKVILRSDKPEAKKFTRWVTHEVLPTIRKTGGYAPQNATIQAMERVAECMETVSEQLSSLAKRVTVLERGQSKSQPSAMAMLTEDVPVQIPGRAARRRWMRTLNEKLDLLEVRFNASRSALLHQLYLWIEERFDVVLDEERLKVVERQGLDDCSVLMAIYYNESFREQMQKNIDANLALEDQGW